MFKPNAEIEFQNPLDILILLVVITDYKVHSTLLGA